MGQPLKGQVAISVELLWLLVFHRLGRYGQLTYWLALLGHLERGSEEVCYYKSVEQLYRTLPGYWPSAQRPREQPRKEEVPVTFVYSRPTEGATL